MKNFGRGMWRRVGDYDKFYKNAEIQRYLALLEESRKTFVKKEPVIAKEESIIIAEKPMAEETPMVKEPMAEETPMTEEPMAEEIIPKEEEPVIKEVTEKEPSKKKKKSKK
jgi:polyhydroxyalkanoate synthesis regulator protein